MRKFLSIQDSAAVNVMHKNIEEFMLVITHPGGLMFI